MRDALALLESVVMGEEIALPSPGREEEVLPIVSDSPSPELSQEKEAPPVTSTVPTSQSVRRTRVSHCNRAVEMVSAFTDRTIISPCSFISTPPHCCVGIPIV